VAHAAAAWARGAAARARNAADDVRTPLPRRFHGGRAPTSQQLLPLFAALRATRRRPGVPPAWRVPSASRRLGCCLHASGCVRLLCLRQLSPACVVGVQQHVRWVRTGTPVQRPARSHSHSVIFAEASARIPRGRKAPLPLTKRAPSILTVFPRPGALRPRFRRGGVQLAGVPLAGARAQLSRRGATATRDAAAGPVGCVLPLGWPAAAACGGAACRTHDSLVARACRRRGADGSCRSLRALHPQDRP
jgi:hypothetical protein